MSARCNRRRFRVEALEARDVPAVLAAEIPFQGDAIIVRVADDSAPPAAGMRSLGGQGLYSVSVPAGRTVAETVAQYAAKPGVVYAEPNYLLSGVTGTTAPAAAAPPAAAGAASPDDPLYADGTLWGLHNTGQAGGLADADIDAPEGWAARTSAGGLVVGVIDSGIDYTHPDLANNIWTNPGETPNDGIDNDKNGYVDDVHGYDFVNRDGDPMDDFGHGTLVAGVIAAEGNNGQGVTGVAQTGVRLMALKWIDSVNGGTVANAVEAINYSVNMGVPLTNNSWFTGDHTRAIKDAVAAADRAGQLFVTIAMNFGANNETVQAYPATLGLPNVVSVAAVGRTGALAGFSDYGRNVDIAAPGVGITTTATSFPGAILSDGTPYLTEGGTSLAAPYVTGALALLKAAHPAETPGQLKARLLAESAPLPGSAGATASGGILNLGNLLNPAPRVVKLATVETAAGKVAKLRLTFSESMNPATLTKAGLRVTGPLGTVIPVTKVTAVDAARSVFEVTIPAQNLAGGGLRVRLAPTVKSAAGGRLDQDHDGTGGEADDAFLGAVATVTAPGGAVTGNAGTDFPITVPAGLGTVTDVDVQAGVDHPAIGELHLAAVNPAGQVVALAGGRGVWADAFAGTVFDDDASKHIRAGVGPYAGAYQPDGILNAFRGTPAAGAWQFRVTDTDPTTADAGQVNAVALTVAGAGDASRLAVTAAVPADESGSALAPRPTGFRVTFNGAVNPLSVSAGDFRVTGPGNKLFRVLSVVPLAGTGGTAFRVNTAPLDRAGTYTLKVGPSVAGVLGQAMDGDGDGLAAEPTDGFAATVPVRDSVFTSDKPVSLIAGGKIVSTITVDRAVTIDQIAVDLSIRNQYAPALTITLTSPGGRDFVLYDQDGGTYASLANLTRTVFSDAAATDLAAGSPPYRGDFKPRDSLASLTGTTAKGRWTLTVQVNVGNEIGQLEAWGLHITPTAGGGS